ncbi:response regulator transcription factor [Bradyrhizobium sp. WSM 1738]|uniref:response regulator transcription factor n=1 Tax=Bradyrhizobium hereditatis TaxID=2821405 RepID=UPI001CE25CFA|nr:response regulator transcription factor [Bradyrhizobium hereditatis]MCA6115359.1 response regulator transcription factor [Bradyrhizobium hereditatis]
MDQVASDDARDNDPWEPLASALRGGLIIADARGQIVWIDDDTRRRVNGGLQNLELPIRKSGATTIDCFVTSVDLTVNGEQSTVCVIQEVRDSGRDLITAIESVLTDTSSFTRNMIDKLKSLRPVAHPLPLSTDIELLTDREREVLGLICEGKSDIDMSKQLRLSQNTVRNHVASLYRKIGVNRRSAAIIWARERGITTEVALGGSRHKRVPPELRRR